MIVCHCARISDGDIRAAISWMRAADPHAIITRGKIYRALGKWPDCGGCIPLFMSTMSKSDAFGVPPILQDMRRPPASPLKDMEG